MPLFKYPVVIVSLISILAFWFIQPFGNFPLNDDWQYAHVAKNIFETGQLVIDVPIAPSIVLQSYLGSAWMQLVGFSHFKLRLLSFFVGLLFFLGLNQVLNELKVTRQWKLAALVTMALNPLFLHFQLSFMTEIYGFTLQIYGLYFWMVSRRKKSFALALASIVLLSLTFWIRQYCILIVPSLFLSEWARNRKSLDFYTRWSFLTVVSLGIVASYFFWASNSGNARPEFSVPMQRMIDPEFALWRTHLYLFSIYVLLCFFPFFAHLFPQWRQAISKKFWTWPVMIYFGIAIFTAHRWFIKGVQGYSPQSSFNHVMPYLGNVLSAFGVGPVTTTDVYIEQRSQLISGGSWIWVMWIGVTVFLFFCLPLVVILLRRVIALNESEGEKESGFSVPVLLYSGIFFNLLVAIQAYKGAVFDRYYFPALLLALVLMAWTFKNQRLKPILFIASGLLFWMFSVIGMHDYFRWNEVRTQLVSQARVLGVLPQLDAGYEINGWLHYEEGRQNCGPAQAFFCTNLPYQIAWSLSPAGRLLEEVEVHGIWFRFPTLKLIQK